MWLNIYCYFLKYFAQYFTVLLLLISQYFIHLVAVPRHRGILGFGALFVTHNHHFTPQIRTPKMCSTMWSHIDSSLHISPWAYKDILILVNYLHNNNQETSPDSKSHNGEPMQNPIVLSEARWEMLRLNQ